MTKMTLNCLQDIYTYKVVLDEETNEEVEKEVLVKKDASCRKLIDLSEINELSEVFNGKGKIREDRVKVSRNNKDDIIVKMSFDDLNSILHKELNKIGYK